MAWSSVWCDVRGSETGGVVLLFSFEVRPSDFVAAQFVAHEAESRPLLFTHFLRGEQHVLCTREVGTPCSCLSPELLTCSDSAAFCNRHQNSWGSLFLLARPPVKNISLLYVNMNFSRTKVTEWAYVRTCYWFQKGDVTQSVEINWRCGGTSDLNVLCKRSDCKFFFERFSQLSKNRVFSDVTLEFGDVFPTLRTMRQSEF
jgi:hypothetical protein